MEAYIHFPILALGPHLIQTHVGPVHAASLLCEFLCALLLLCLEGFVSLVSSIPSGTYTLFKRLVCLFIYIFMCMDVMRMACIYICVPHAYRDLQFLWNWNYRW